MWSKKFISQWLDEYDMLRGWVYEPHTEAQRYLQHLGFTIHNDRVIEAWRGGRFKEFSQVCAIQQ